MICYKLCFHPDCFGRCPDQKEAKHRKFTYADSTLSYRNSIILMPRTYSSEPILVTALVGSNVAVVSPCPLTRASDWTSAFGAAATDEIGPRKLCRLQIALSHLGH